MEIQEELIKEVFARFGAASYHSEILHRGLCNAYASATFERAEDVTRPRLEEKFTLAFSLTLGQIIEKTKDLLPSDLRERLEIALDKRNYLAHRFWFERCPLMFSETGLIELNQELTELGDLFAGLDEEITEYFKPKREAFGVSDEMIQQSFEELLFGDSEEPLISQRFPKRQERIVMVWDVIDKSNIKVQIFRTEDGCLWQFCDVGLGWTMFETPSRDWVINEKIQKYLPANINPRPPTAEPWNYEFKLAKGAVLWVKRRKPERSYTWGVREP